MYSITVSSVLALAARAYAREAVVSLSDKLLTTLVKRVRKGRAFYYTDLENSTLGKQTNLARHPRPTIATPVRRHYAANFLNPAIHASMRRPKPRHSVKIAPVNMSTCGRIVVAGGGIGGSAVAVALQNKGFDVIVLEKDDSFDSRKQGYGLTIQQAGSAIRKLGITLTDDAPSNSHYAFSSDGRIVGFFGRAFLHGGNSSGGTNSTKEQRPAISLQGAPVASRKHKIHIPRQLLRSKIIDRIRPGTIWWSSKLQNFSCWSANGSSRQGSAGENYRDREHENHGVSVTLTNGTTIDAALLIAADGIFSAVRRQLHLPGDRLNYLGVVVVLGIVYTGPVRRAVNGDDSHAHDAKSIMKDSGEGLDREFALPQRRIFETVDGVTRIYAMPFTENVTMWQLSFPYPESAANAMAGDPAALKAEALRRCGEWHDPIPALLHGTPLGSISGGPVFDRDLLEPHILRPEETSVMQTSASQPVAKRRVTVLGDAAHPMSPFKGQGANQALLDAVLLADILEDNVQRHGVRAGLDTALPRYEQEMLKRSARQVLASREAAERLHSLLATQHIGEAPLTAAGAAMPEVRRFDTCAEAFRVLRERGIGAESASEPCGLDTVVADAVGNIVEGGCPSALHRAKMFKGREKQQQRQ